MRWSLKSVTIQNPSEHRIAGLDYDAEWHFHHEASGGERLKVAVLVKEGRVVRSGQTLIQGLGQRSYSPRKIANIDLRQLLPRELPYYTYLGSSTVPPCEEGVVWVVLANPSQLGRRELDRLGNLFPESKRPIQGTGSRVVMFMP